MQTDDNEVRQRRGISNTVDEAWRIEGGDARPPIVGKAVVDIASADKRNRDPFGGDDGWGLRSNKIVTSPKVPHPVSLEELYRRE